MELLLYAVFFSVLFPIGYFANETFNRYWPSEGTSHITHGPGKFLLLNLSRNVGVFQLNLELGDLFLCFKLC